jgi:hypothetical protein
MEPRNMSLLLWSLADMALYPPQDVMRQVAAALGPQLGRLPPQELTNTLQVSTGVLVLVERG